VNLEYLEEVGVVVLYLSVLNHGLLVLCMWFLMEPEYIVLVLGTIALILKRASGENNNKVKYSLP